MTIDLTQIFAVAFLPLLLITAAVLALAWVSRPWELRGGRLIDRLRVAETVSNYDFWLSWRGVSRRRRADLRAELRANLWDATLRVGSKQAVRAVGPTRRLAASSTASPQGPKWGHGLVAGLIVVELVAGLQLLAATAFTDAAIAAKVAHVEGPIVLLPGTHVSYDKVAGGGFAFELSLGPLALVIGLVVFLVIARPWRLGRRVGAAAA